MTYIDWISQFSTTLRSLDALHLAIADSNNLTLITADIKLSNSAMYFGVEFSIIA